MAASSVVVGVVIPGALLGALLGVAPTAGDPVSVASSVKPENTVQTVFYDPTPPPLIYGATVVRDSRSGTTETTTRLLGYKPFAAGDYKFSSTPSGSPARWNGCESITWSWQGASSGESSAARRAFRDVSAATGFRFRKTTSRANISISKEPIPGETVGLGGHNYSGYPGYQAIIQSGWVKVEPDFGRMSKNAQHELLIHELGHVVNLAHVDARSEIMFPTMKGQKAYGAGDREGMRLVGKQQGCAVFPKAPTNLRVSISRGDISLSWRHNGEKHLLSKTVARFDGREQSLPGSARRVRFDDLACRDGARVEVTAISKFGAASIAQEILDCGS